MQRGFRVLALDHPMHGNTPGTESGCHVFGFTLNCVLNYIQEPTIFLVHSLSNEAVSMSYYISDEKTRNQIKGFVGISVLDKITDCIINFGKMSGLDDYTCNLFLEKNSEKLGIDFSFFVLSETIKNFNYPCLIIHDENDREVPIDSAINLSKYVQKNSRLIK
jgi:pimeloyl-ACP methyl ester carboxylesterase